MPILDRLDRFESVQTPTLAELDDSEHRNTSSLRLWEFPANLLKHPLREIRLLKIRLVELPAI